MGIIVAIGGGEISELETLAIDQTIVDLTNKRNPKALFIPTASMDAQGYCDSFQFVYGDRLGCEVKYLLLTTNTYAPEEIEEMILSADLIYVGGGNTRMMLDIWREHGVDTVLKQAYASGVVLSGMSAGSICWYEYGHSDTETFDTSGERIYIKLKAMGILPGIHCPHYNEDNREADFLEMVKGMDTTGIAIENHCAIIYKDDRYKVISSREQAKAYKIQEINEQMIVTEIEKYGEYNEIANL
ncbi:peptidase E [Paenibacillus piscarius]|uniref:Type 1 glutamine amidotransferase-like domain-containing protein n=1 Tax=Paenibacillus piscarius TaxID=1089681 RepID=UPI001EE7B9CD|nr:peptidase E [Paenibacillus piscarius]